MLEILFAICVGCALFCVNAFCLLVTLKVLGFSLGIYFVASFVAIVPGCIFAIQACKMRWPAAAVLLLIAMLILICNFLFTGHIYSTF